MKVVKWGCLTIIGAVVLLFVIDLVVVAVGNHTTASAPASVGATPTPTPRAVKHASVPSRPVVLVDHRGNGTWTSPTFDPESDWTIGYTYNCASTGAPGNFMVDVYGPGNAYSTDGVNELQAKGQGTTWVHDVKGVGSYLHVISDCAWHLVARVPGH